MHKYEIKVTNSFKKSLNKIRTQKFFDEKALNTVIEILANDEILPDKYRNHLLEPKSKRFMGMPYKARLVINL